MIAGRKVLSPFCPAQRRNRRFIDSGQRACNLWYSAHTLVFSPSSSGTAFLSRSKPMTKRPDCSVCSASKLLLPPLDPGPGRLFFFSLSSPPAIDLGHVISILVGNFYSGRARISSHFTTCPVAIEMFAAMPVTVSFRKFSCFPPHQDFRVWSERKEV